MRKLHTDGFHVFQVKLCLDRFKNLELFLSLDIFSEVATLTAFKKV